MDYLLSISTVLLMILLGGLVCTRQLILKFGDGNEYSRKAKENVRNSWTCLGGIFAVFLASTWLPFLKWIILVFYAGAFIWSFLISTVLPSISAIFTKDMQPFGWLTVLSNFFQSIACASVLLLCIHRCFGWI